MRRGESLIVKSGVAMLAIVCTWCIAAPFQISSADLANKIKGAWLGKTAGVCIGGPTEFQSQGPMYTGAINLSPDLSQGFTQDDIYVQVTFISAMDAKLSQPAGIFSTTMIDYGNTFKNTSYELWWANNAGRNNIRNGILPPLSGMWGGTAATRKNDVAEAIDFQIESDWIGIMSPAMPLTAVRLCDSVGHVMNYADGLYGGYFMSAMHALAFRYSDPHVIVKKAMQCLPKSSTYYKIINDVVTFHDQNPTQDYAACWTYITTTKNWLTFKASPCIIHDQWGSGTGPGRLNITANLNGAYVAIGLMYGDGDIKKSIEYAIRGGQDSDCNGANAGAVIGTMLGFDALPAEWKNSIGQATTQTYSSSNYTYAMLINSSVARAQKCIIQMGGTLSGFTYTINAEEPAQPKMLEVYGADPVVNPDYGVASVSGHPALTTRAPSVLTSLAYTIAGRRIAGSNSHSTIASGIALVVRDGRIVSR